MISTTVDLPWGVGVLFLLAGCGGVTAYAAGEPENDDVANFDLQRIQHVINDGIDFAKLIHHLKRKHGIKLQRIVGAGSASAIFEGDADIGGDESRKVTVKIIDHSMVRASVSECYIDNVSF